MNHQTSIVPHVIPQVAYQSPQAPTQLMNESPFVDSDIDGRVTVQQVPKGARAKLFWYIWLGTLHSAKRTQECCKVIRRKQVRRAQEAGLNIRLKQLAFLADPGIPAAVLMTNIFNYGSDVISKVPHSETYLNDIENQSVHAMQDFEQTSVMDVTDDEITSDSNIIPYSQYLQETQQENEKANKEQNNESVTAELERYKERVKNFEQRFNIDLSSREKMIDSQMDNMIKEKFALKEQVDSLKQNLFKQIKEKESLLQTFAVFKNESKEKENKYMENVN
ncbi:hypothetical protein Tco_1311517 [Tanacetum coccineum]